MNKYERQRKGNNKTVKRNQVPGFNGTCPKTGGAHEDSLVSAGAAEKGQRKFGYACRRCWRTRYELVPAGTPAVFVK